MSLSYLGVVLGARAPLQPWLNVHEAVQVYCVQRGVQRAASLLSHFSLSSYQVITG